MSQKEAILRYIKGQKNGSTRCETFLGLQKCICWQSVGGRIDDLEQEGSIYWTGERRHSIWNKPNKVYKAKEQ